MKKALNVIELIIKYHPLGIQILEGKYPPPCVEEWDEILNMKDTHATITSVKKNPNSDRFLNMIIRAEGIEENLKICGGWNGINEAVNTIKNKYGELWQEFKDFCDIVYTSTKCRSIYKGLSPSEYVAQKYGVTPKTLRSRKNFILEQIIKTAIAQNADKVNR